MRSEKARRIKIMAVGAMFLAACALAFTGDEGYTLVGIGGALWLQTWNTPVPGQPRADAFWRSPTERTLFLVTAVVVVVAIIVSFILADGARDYVGLGLGVLLVTVNVIPTKPPVDASSRPAGDPQSSGDPSR